jgi:hypothetical protein
MPTFENVAVETSIDVDFEVYCGTCGAGLCSVSDTRKSNNRGYLQVTVDACPDCMKEKEDEIDDLKAQIKELEDKLYAE